MKATTTNSLSKTTNKNPETRRPLDDEIKQLIKQINDLEDRMKLIFGFNPLTPNERRRLMSSGIRNYGFLDKTFDLSETNMQFAPGTFNRNEYWGWIARIEALRNILVAVKQLTDVVSDNLLMSGDNAMRLGLIYYTTLRDLARHGDQGALEVFEMLRPFFKRRRPTSSEPTEKQLEKDIHALLHGSKDGKIVIENEMPTITKGKRVVVDETQKRKGGFKATIEDEER